MKDDFNHILENVQMPLEELEEMVRKYRSLGTVEKRTWDRLRSGLKELNTIWQRLAYQTTQVQLLLDSVRMNSMGRIETLLEEFLKEARSGKRAPTILSIEHGGDQAALGWRQLESDLSESGILLDDIESHREDIEEYIERLTSNLELNSMSSIVDSHSDQISENNWDSISQRMAMDQKSATQPQQLNGMAVNPSRGNQEYPAIPANLEVKNPLVTSFIHPSGHKWEPAFSPESELELNMSIPASSDGDLEFTNETNETVARLSYLLKDSTETGTWGQAIFKAQIATLHPASEGVMRQNKDLKQQLLIATREIEVIKATWTQDLKPAPLRYSATDFYAEVLRSNSEKTPSHRTITNERGERLLAAGATWDYTIKDPLYRQGQVDVGAVSDRLKTVAKCDGIGPVFMQSDIDDATEEG